MVSFNYAFWPGDDFSEVSDEFVIGSFRISLQGSSLTVHVEEPVNDHTDAARKLASQYAEALRQCGAPFVRLLTWAELRAMPAQFFTVHSSESGERQRLARCLRTARRALLGTANARLAQCYDYLQDGREDAKHTFFYLYKMVETLETELGGEREALRVLAIRNELKSIKTWANRPASDERHAPSGPAERSKLSETDRELALRHARTILGVFESHWRRTHRHGEPSRQSGD